MLAAAPAAAAQAAGRVVAKGRLKQSVCRWCYGKIPLDDLCAAGEANGPGRHRPAHPRRLPHAQEARPDLHDDQLRRLDRRRPLATRSTTTRSLKAIHAAIEVAAPRGLEERHLLLRQPPRHRRQDGHEELRRGPQARSSPSPRRTTSSSDGAAQQQGRPQGLHVRPLRLGRRAGQAGRLRRLQAALRHLPHADHGRRRDPHDRGRPRRTSATTTPAATPAGTRSTRRRS